MTRRRAKGEGTVWYSEKKNQWIGQITLLDGRKRTKKAKTQSEVKKMALGAAQGRTRWNVPA